MKWMAAGKKERRRGEGLVGGTGGEREGGWKKESRAEGKRKWEEKNREKK